MNYNQLTNHQLTNSLINLLHRARKNNKILQNKANFKNHEMFVTPYNTGYYDVLWLVSHPKNKAKQSQFKPNFSPKLALFFKEIFAFANIFVTSVCSVVKNNLVQICVYSWLKHPWNPVENYYNGFSWIYLRLRRHLL